MKRAAGLLMIVGAISGCAGTGGEQVYQAGAGGLHASPPIPPALKGAVGPWGQPVTAVPPVGPNAVGARGGVGPEVTQTQPISPTGAPVVPANHIVGGPGMPPAAAPGAMPIPPMMPPTMPPTGVIPAGAVAHATAASAYPAARSQVRFVGPAGGKIGWYVAGPTDSDGKPVMVPHQLDIPGRYNFIQGSIYRLKISDVPGRPGEWYPTIEVVPGNAKTEAFLAHNAIPVEFTNEDFDQVAAGNFITKVIYLPDAQYQSPVTAGPEELVSTRLEPGVDPIAEALRRGHILLVVRLGGIDLESPNTPPMDNHGLFGAPMVGQAAPMMPPANLAPVPQAPTLPGVAQAMPSGLPGVPPVVTPPMPPQGAPPAPPNGPMVPAVQGTLPPMPVAGMPSTYPQNSSNVQPVGHVIAPDGKRIPVKYQTGKATKYPLTTIPASAGKTSVAPDDGEDDDQQQAQPVKKAKPKRPVRRGLLNRLFKR